MRIGSRTQTHDQLSGVDSDQHHGAGQNMDAPILFDNNVRLQWLSTLAVVRNLVGLDAVNVSNFGVQAHATRLISSGILTENSSAGVFTVLSRRQVIARHKTATQTINSQTTLQNVTDMLWPVGANENWLFLIGLEMVSDTVPDYRFAFSVPAASGGRSAHLYNDIQGAGSFPLTSAIFLSVPDTNIRSLLIWGIYVGGANAGTVQLQFAQNASDAANTEARIDSFLMAMLAEN